MLNPENNLEKINFNDNPVTEEKGDSFKSELLIILVPGFTKLKSINKEEITAEEREDAIKEKEERRKAAEEERLAKEAEEAERLAEEERARKEAEEAERQAEEERR